MKAALTAVVAQPTLAHQVVHHYDAETGWITCRFFVDGMWR